MSTTPHLRAVATTYLQNLKTLLDTVDLDAIERIIGRLRDVRDASGTIYVAGNGGSTATATHWVNDLCKATKVNGRTPVRAMSLGDNISWLTALANDEGYDRVFAGQLENFATKGDILVVISASGNSPNLMRAVETALENEVVTVGLLGFDGGRLLEMVDDVIWLKTQQGEYGLVETGHVVVTDVITTCLMKDLAEETEDGS